MREAGPIRPRSQSRNPRRDQGDIVAWIVTSEELLQRRRDGAYDFAGGSAPDGGDDLRQPVLPERLTLRVRCLDDAVGVHEKKVV